MAEALLFFVPFLVVVGIVIGDWNFKGGESFEQKGKARSSN
ncbi:hypothetical protein [Bacillus sp. JJ1474]